MTPPLDPIEIDLLVEGELPDDRRRALIRRLEASPESWRDVALAFLQAQEFAKAARAFAADLADLPLPIKGAPAVPSRVRSKPRRLAVAASLVAALFLSGLALGALVSRQAGPGPAGPLASGPTPPPAGVGVEVKALPPPDLSWAEARPPAVSDYVRSQWERRGYQIEQQRKLITLELKDGRRVSIPIDDVRVEFVGRRVY